MAFVLLKASSSNAWWPEERWILKSEREPSSLTTKPTNASPSSSNTKVTKGVSPLLDAEALRVVKSMPAWIPGKQRGQTVRVAFVVPINFNLSESPVFTVVETSFCGNTGKGST